MITQRKLRWCDSCKRMTPHEVKGKLKACTICHLRTEVLWERGPQTENEPEGKR